MSRFFNPDNPIMEFIAKIFDLILLNLLITDWIPADMPHGFSDIKLTACRIYSVTRRSVHYLFS